MRSGDVIETTAPNCWWPVGVPDHIRSVERAGVYGWGCAGVGWESASGTPYIGAGLPWENGYAVPEGLQLHQATQFAGLQASGAGEPPACRSG